MFHAGHIFLIEDLFPGDICTCAIKQTSDFFERRALRFDKQEPDTKTFDDENGNVHEVKLPG